MTGGQKEVRGLLNRPWHPCWDADPGWAQRNWAVGTGNWMKPKGPGQWTPGSRSASNACSKHLLQHFWGQRAHPFKAAHALGGPFLYRGQTIAFNIQPFLPVPTSQHCVRHTSALLDPGLLYSQTTTIGPPCTLPIRHLEKSKVSALGGHGGQHGAQPPRDQVKHSSHRLASTPLLPCLRHLGLTGRSGGHLLGTRAQALHPLMIPYTAL